MQSFQNGHALSIGVGQTIHHERWSLPVTVKDANAMYDVLQNPQICGYPKEQITLLHNQFATAEQINRELIELAELSKQKTDSTMIIYFSGHGWQGEDGSYALIPSDVKPRQFKDTVISGEDFAEKISKIKSKRLLVILDCCHAGGIEAKGEDLAPQRGYIRSALPEEYVKSIVDNQNREGRSVLFSSKPTQLSYYFPDHSLSIFTYHLLEAFAGIGCQESDQFVMETHLVQHVGKTVHKTVFELWGLEQNPMRRTTGEDFPVAMINHSSAVYKHLPSISTATVGEPHKRIDLPSIYKRLQKLDARNFEIFTSFYFSSVANNFSSDMALDRQRFLLVDHCRRKEQLGELQNKLDEYEKDSQDDTTVVPPELINKAKHG